MQSNKSSKERDGAEKDKQTAFFFFFTKQCFQQWVFWQETARDRVKERRADEGTDTDMQEEIGSTNAKYMSGTL